MAALVTQRRIALGQISTKIGDTEHNAELMAQRIAAARDAGCRAIIFPELALTGYVIDRRFSDAATMLDSDIMKRFRELSRSIDVCFGFIEETRTSLFYNSAVYLCEGRIRHLHRKIYLPTYGPFDEKRYYGSGWDVSAFESTVSRSALLICGDAWHLPLPYLAAHDGADLLIIIAASSKQGLSDTTSCERAWEWMCRSYALTLSCFVIFVNRAGSDGEHDYWGGSFVIGPDGNLVVQSQTEEDDLLIADVDLAWLRRQRVKLPFRRDDSLAYTLQLGQRIVEAKIQRDTFYADTEDIEITQSPPAKPR